ncbi:MAG TPA: rRNA maturation RNase YbeY, partial [Steroidobacteraceae bacterium]
MISSGTRISLMRTVRTGWLPGPRVLRAWAVAALGRQAAGREVAVLLAGRARSRALNARYRGRDHATNVLSFPAAAPASAAAPRLLGELVICPPVLRAEARAQHKSESAHWAHMVVHGLLHLIGYDHQYAAEAQRMERREVRALHRLGIANPYRVAPAAAARAPAAR